MTGHGSSLVLRRSPIGRVLGGAKLQPLLTFMTIVVAGVLVEQAAGRMSAGQEPIGVTAGILLVLAALTFAGATGYAYVDAEGVTWRYYVRHHVRWSEVEQVTLKVTSTGVGGIWRHVEIRTRRRRLRVTPVHSAGPDRVPFARNLLALAAAQGCEVRDEWRRD